MTEKASSSLLSKTAGGAGWVVGFRMVTRLLGIVSTLTLARVLGPSDFGLVALASGFAQTVDTLTNLSVHEAIIRERDPPRAMYDTAFTMNLLRGLLVSLIVGSLAWPAADFFREPRLTPVLLALAFSNLVGSIENIATANFVKDFAFRREFKLWTVPRILQVIGTIGFALIWPTYWALVFGIVGGRLIRTVLSYAMVPYRPRLDLSEWRRIMGFTTWSWAIYVVAVIRERADTLLIGRLFSPGQVGVYALGGEIAVLPTSELVDPLCRACFPSFSQLRNDGLSVRQIYVRLLGAASMLVLPAGVGIAAVADPLVRLAFGPKWVEAIPMIQILGVTATMGVIGSLSGTLFSAYAMLRTTFAITVSATALRVVFLLAFLPGGTLVTAATVVAAVTFAEQSTYLILTMRRFGISIGELMRAVSRSLVATLVMAGCLLWFGLGFTPVADWFFLHLALDAGVGATIYVTVLFAAWFAAGRPQGPETDLLLVLRKVFGYLQAKIARHGLRG